MPTPGYTFLPNDSVTADKLNLSVSGLTFTEGTIPGSALTNNTVTRAKISDSAVDNAKVAVNTLTPDRLVKAVAVSPATNLDGQLLISGLDGNFAAKTLSGGISVAESGAVTLGDYIIQARHLADACITDRVMTPGAIRTHHLNTLVYDESGSSGDYAANLPGVAKFIGLELKLFVNLRNTNTAGVRLFYNGSATPDHVLKPGGGKFEVGEIGGGTIVSLVWTGAYWLVLSSWVTSSAAETVLTSAEGNNVFAFPAIPAPVAGALQKAYTNVRIRVWGAGGTTNPIVAGTPNIMPVAGAYRAGGGGGYAEWSGTPAQAGLNANPAGTQLVVEATPSSSIANHRGHVLIKKLGETAPLLKVYHGANGYYYSINGSFAQYDGIGGSVDTASTLVTAATQNNGTLVSAAGGAGSHTTTGTTGGAGSHGYARGGGDGVAPDTHRVIVAYTII